MEMQWQLIDQRQLNSLCEFIPQRLRECLKFNGGHTYTLYTKCTVIQVIGAKCIADTLLYIIYLHVLTAKYTYTCIENRLTRLGPKSSSSNYSFC